MVDTEQVGCIPDHSLLKLSIEIPSSFVNVECIANTNDLIQNEDYDLTLIPEMYF